MILKKISGIFNLGTGKTTNLEKIASNILKVINEKGKLLICGNGGSAADSQHLAAELIVRLNKNINREPIPAFLYI